ncbi:hypothetical protein EJ04DRAFT_539996 [Polyplosphaeria fusca]|uniref:VWFA domain-containing protein n=1 Tax=Polyplosphaeria fusca TaxID=682080 RepID=A0A9P4V8P2_9PLEO|nr:hypothetical protein EJ04DRAFT_539996 [Polyplosphaeria fusca]
MSLTTTLLFDHGGASSTSNLPEQHFQSATNEHFADQPGMNAFSTPNDPPPAYTPGPSSDLGVQAVQAVSEASELDDRYAFLGTFDTIFLIDDSGSMAGGRWVHARNAIQTIAPICTKYDADGIDIHFLNQKDEPIFNNVKLSSTVMEIFTMVKPRGGTPTGQRLNNILKPYLERYAKRPTTTKPINIIIITDGEPSDDVESPIISAAKKLDKLDAESWQVGIQFFQVGKDAAAREHLKQLDDGLSELAGQPIRDIVDTVPFQGQGNGELTAEGILKCVLGAVNRRLDRNSRELHRPR